MAMFKNLLKKQQEKEKYYRNYYDRSAGNFFYDLLFKLIGIAVILGIVFAVEYLPKLFN